MCAQPEPWNHFARRLQQAVTLDHAVPQAVGNMSPRVAYGGRASAGTGHGLGHDLRREHCRRGERAGRTRRVGNNTRRCGDSNAASYPQPPPRNGAALDEPSDGTCLAKGRGSVVCSAPSRARSAPPPKLHRGRTRRPVSHGRARPDERSGGGRHRGVAHLGHGRDGDPAGAACLADTPPAVRRCDHAHRDALARFDALARDAPPP